MERPASIPEAAWATMTPEIRVTVISAMQQAVTTAVASAVKTTTDTVTKKVTKKMRSELTMHNLLQMGGPEADSAKALLKAATSGTHSIVDIVQRLKALEMQIQDRATQVEKTLTLTLTLSLTLTLLHSGGGGDQEGSQRPGAGYRPKTETPNRSH